MPRTVLDHFNDGFRDVPNGITDPILNWVSPNLPENDRVSDGNILGEMPLDSNCGEDCKLALNAAKKLVSHINDAFGHDEPELIHTVIYAAVRTCVCYIRG